MIRPLHWPREKKKHRPSVVKSYIAVPDVKHPATFKDSNQTLVPVQHWSICWISFSTNIETGCNLVPSTINDYSWDDMMTGFFTTTKPTFQSFKGVGFLMFFEFCKPQKFSETGNLQDHHYRYQIPNPIHFFLSDSLRYLHLAKF